MNKIVFEYLLFLYFLPLIILLFLLYERFVIKKKSLRIPSISFLSTKKSFFDKIFFFMPKIIRIMILSSLLIVLSRPILIQTVEVKKTISNDIVIAMDVSGSMLANDFKPNRLQVAINKAIEFVEKRHSDRIAIVLYAAESFVLVPLTLQKNFIIEQLKNIKTGFIQDGTAIGLGLATAINTLENSISKRKVIILLTDGVNNSGLITPIDAANIANNKNIRIYTVGIGSTGKAMVPKYYDGTGPLVTADIHLDEDILKKIADITGGRYFSAQNEINLQKSYENINHLEQNEKITIKINKVEDLSKYFLFLCFVLIFVELIVRLWLIKIFP